MNTENESCGPTPGPWTARQWEGPAWIVLAPKGVSPGILAQTVGGNDEANARLIAATPDLLASLLELVDRRALVAPHRRDGSDGRYARARAALEKAGVDMARYA